MNKRRRFKAHRRRRAQLLARRQQARQQAKGPMFGRILGTPSLREILDYIERMDQQILERAIGAGFLTKR